MKHLLETTEHFVLLNLALNLALNLLAHLSLGLVNIPALTLAMTAITKTELQGIPNAKGAAS